MLYHHSWASLHLAIKQLVDLVVMSPLFIRWLAQMEEQAKKNDQRLQELAEAQAARLQEEEEEEVQSEVTEANG